MCKISSNSYLWLSEYWENFFGVSFFGASCICNCANVKLTHSMQNCWCHQVLFAELLMSSSHVLESNKYECCTLDLPHFFHSFTTTGRTFLIFCWSLKPKIETKANLKAYFWSQSKSQISQFRWAQNDAKNSTVMNAYCFIGLKALKLFQLCTAKHKKVNQENRKMFVKTVRWFVTP